MDKSKQSARNNRSVNIARLRSIFSEIGSCTISNDTGYWRFEFDRENPHIDLYECLELAKNSQSWLKEEMEQFLDIIRKGPALSNIDADWIDAFKAELSNEIIDRVLGYINEHASKDDPDFTINLVNSIFIFDMINEEAMKIKCQVLASHGKHSLAKDTYTAFIKEYKTLYAEDYTKTFKQILGHT